MTRPAPGRGGFSLVEVTLAIGVAGFCLLAIFGLLPVGLRTNQSAVEQTAANGILSAVAAELRATPRTVPPGGAVPQGNPPPNAYNIPIPANPVTAAPAPTSLFFTEDGQCSASRTKESRYLVTVTFLPNGSNARNATYVNLQVQWPAVEGATRGEGSVQMFLALDRN